MVLRAGRKTTLREGMLFVFVRAQTCCCNKQTKKYTVAQTEVCFAHVIGLKALGRACPSWRAFRSRERGGWQGHALRVRSVEKRTSEGGAFSPRVVGPDSTG